MTGQRKHHLAFIALFLLSAARCWAGAPDIMLPEPFAVALPDGAADLGPDDPAMRALADRVTVAGHTVTAALPRRRIGPGAWQVIWSAWEGKARDFPAARRDSVLVVLPHGVIPLGRTGYASAAHIARDASGTLHMVWTDAWRGGAIEGAMYRRVRIMPDGSAVPETDIQSLAPRRGNWTAMPALAAAGDSVHFAWQDNGTTRYRSVTRVGTEWRWSEDIDTKAPAPRKYFGPAIAADRNGVHILTSDGRYIGSRDGGRTWTAEPGPFAAADLGTMFLTLDGAGRPLASTNVQITGPEKGAFRPIRTARRLGSGQWQPVPSPIDGRLDWAPPATPAEAVVTDGVQVLEDRTGALHALWHGTAISRTEDAPRAYYAWRPPNGAWGVPVPLREPDELAGFATARAAGLALDGEQAMTLVTRDIHQGWRYRGANLEMTLFRDGVRRAEPVPVTSHVLDAMREAEPAQSLSVAAVAVVPGLVRDTNGRTWADILIALQPTRVSAPAVLVLRRLDVSDKVTAAR